MTLDVLNNPSIRNALQVGHAFDVEVDLLEDIQHHQAASDEKRRRLSWLRKDPEEVARLSRLYQSVPAFFEWFFAWTESPHWHTPRYNFSRIEMSGLDRQAGVLQQFPDWPELRVLTVRSQWAIVKEYVHTNPVLASLVQRCSGRVVQALCTGETLGAVVYKLSRALSAELGYTSAIRQLKQRDCTGVSSPEKRELQMELQRLRFDADTLRDQAYSRYLQSCVRLQEWVHESDPDDWEKLPNPVQGTDFTTQLIQMSARRLTQKAMVQATGKSESTIRRALKELRKQGRLSE